MEYKPKLRRGKVCIPFGYYVSPIDPKILIPDPKKLDAIHYAFRMKAKYGTSIRDCTMWLHGATGQRMTPAGFMYAYKNWIGRLRKDKRQKLSAERKAKFLLQQKFVEENLKQFGVLINDGSDISAVAEGDAKKAWKKAERG